MAAGNRKLVVISALILAAGLLTGAIRARAVAGSAQAEAPVIPPNPEQVQSEGSGSLSRQGADLFGQPSATPGGRELFYKMLLSVSLVIALGIAAIYISRKLLPRIAKLPGREIRVIETAYIAPRKGLHLIQVGRRRLLIATTNESITMLADVTEAASAFAAQMAERS